MVIVLWALSARAGDVPLSEMQRTLIKARDLLVKGDKAGARAAMESFDALAKAVEPESLAGLSPAMHGLAGMLRHQFHMDYTVTAAWLAQAFQENAPGKGQQFMAAMAARFGRAEILQHYLKQPDEAEKEYRGCLEWLADADDAMREQWIPIVYGSLFCLRVMYPQYHNPDEMDDLMHRQAAWLKRPDKRLSCHLPIMAAIRGRNDEARAYMRVYAEERLAGKDPETDHEVWRLAVPFAYACSYMGDVEEGLVWLEKGLIAKCAEMESPEAYRNYAAWLRNRHGLQTLSADPRFEAVFSIVDDFSQRVDGIE